MSAKSEEKKAKLILHFDINKTLIISDSAGGKNTSDVVNQCLMQSLYGRVLEKVPDLSHLPFNVPEENKVLFRWEAVSKEASEDAPSKELMDFDTFLEREIYPFPKCQNKQEQIKVNQELKQKRRGIISHWHEQGYPGYQFSHLRSQILDKLQVPHPDLANTTLSVNILPSFFQLLIHLVKNERDFRIVFRTFGDLHDISKVTTEFNLLCKNQHPYFKIHDSNIAEKLSNLAIDIQSENHQQIKGQDDNDNSNDDNSNDDNNSKDENIIDNDDCDDKKDKLNESIGYFYINGPDHEKDCYLVVGTVNRPPELNKILVTDLKQMLEQKIDKEKAIQILQGYHDIYEFITKTKGTKAVSDFYYWWSANNETVNSGKLFIVDTSNTELLQIFFDDNIEMPDFPVKGIVNMRDLQTGNALDEQKYLDTCLHNVFALGAIMNPNYFIDALEKCEKNWHHALHSKI